MFETIITSIIQRYLARYININADQLSAQLLSKQQIIIENLTLNKTTLNEDIRTQLKLPISIESFHIGKIQCSLVWSALFFRSSSTAFIIKIEHVHAVIRENTDESSSTTIEEDVETVKRDQLDLIEQQLQKEFECFGDVKSSKWNIQRLLMSFAEKVQIDIIDVHITYESSTSHRIGLTCNRIQISNEPSDEIVNRQVFRIENPGLYVDINHSTTHSYILSPQTSIEIYLKHNHFLVSQQEYRYEFGCLLNDIDIRCNAEQIRILIDIICRIQNSSLHHTSTCDLSRPRIKISKQSARIWWRYVVLMILRTRMSSKNLTTCFWFDRSMVIHRLRQLKTYKRLYCVYLDSKYFECSNFSPEDRFIMNEIETEFDVEHLLIIRRSIFQSQIIEKMSKKRGETTRWYSNYAQWVTSKMTGLWGIPTTNENDMQIQEQVNTFIAESLEDEDLLEKCHDVRIFYFKFVLQSIQIDLLSSNNDRLYDFYLKNLSSTTEFRLRHRSILVSVRLDEFYVRDHGQTEAFSTIISPNERIQQDESQPIPVFEFSFEKKGKSKISIGMRSCGLRIIGCPTSIERLYDFYILVFDQSSLSFRNWKRIKNYIVKYSLPIIEQIMPPDASKSKKQVTLHLENSRRVQYRGKRTFSICINIGATKMTVLLSTHEMLIIDVASLKLTNNAQNKDNVAIVLSDPVLAQHRYQENDSEEFMTPGDSPLGTDSPMENEPVYYSINMFPSDQTDDSVECSSFSVIICDIVVRYPTELLQIVEKFNVSFLIEHPLDHLWPLVNISTILPKLIIHLNLEKIRDLCNSINYSNALIDNLTKLYNQSVIWPAIRFRLDEINILLNDNSSTLCDIRMHNFDLLFTDLLTTLKTPNISLTADINVDKLDCIFYPRCISTLVDLLSDTNFFSWSQSVLVMPCKTDIKIREMNALFNHITPTVPSIEVHLRTMRLNVSDNPYSRYELMVNTVQITKLSNELPQATNDMMVDRKQTVLNIDFGSHSNKEKISQNPALHLVLVRTKDDDYGLSIKIVSLIYYHSLSILVIIRQTLDYFIQKYRVITNQELQKSNQIIWLYNHFSSSGRSLTNSVLPLHRWNLNIDLTTSIIILPNDLTLQLQRIHLTNDYERLSNYNISVDRIDLLLLDIKTHPQVTHTNLPSYKLWPLLENISMSLNPQLSESFISIESTLISSLRIFLCRDRIRFLQQILNSILIQNSTSLFKFAFHLQSTQMIIIFQTDCNHQLFTICEALLDGCQMLYDLNYGNNRKITLQFDSLEIKNRLIIAEDPLIAIKSRSSIELNTPYVDNEYEQLDFKLPHIDIRFIKSTWTVLSEMIGVFESKSNLSEEQAIIFSNDLIKVSFNIDSIACRFEDNSTLLMNIDLQRFNWQVQTCLKEPIASWKLIGQLGFISINDLTIIDQFYNERLCTTATNAFNFTFNSEENSMATPSLDSPPVRSQFHLRMTSIQYIHTQRFFLSILNFLDRLRQNEDFYPRIQSVIFKPMISNIHQQSNGLYTTLELEKIILVVPEHIQKNSVLIFQLDYINLQNQSQNSRSDFITLEMKDIEFYSASHCYINQNISASVHFSHFGFDRIHDHHLTLVRQSFSVNMKIEHNHADSLDRPHPTYIIKMNLTPIDILFDINHYHLIQNILIENLNEQSPIELEDFFSLKDAISTNFIVTLEIDHVGLEIFLLNMDLLSLEYRQSLGYAVLMNLHLSFDHYCNGNQSLHLLCSSIKLKDTRNQNKDMILLSSILSSTNQLEIYLIGTVLDNQCTLTLNSMRFLFIVDWFVELNGFLHSCCEQHMPITSFDIKLNLNQFELVVAPTTADPYCSALVYSSTMIIDYKHKNSRPLECVMSDFTFYTCQIGDINETRVSIIEPTDCSLTVHSSNEQICEITIPTLNIRLSYSDVKMIYSLFHTISKQISQTKTRKPLLTFIATILTSPLRECQSSTYTLLNIKFIKFSSDQICLCLIDDCFDVNIPLLNINLKSFNVQTIENDQFHRTEQSHFELIISYYNRFQSGFEPLIEMCLLQMILTRSPLTTSLSISSKDLLNLNFTKAMYRLYGIVKTNWFTDYQNDSLSRKKIGFRRVKPIEPYCFKNCIGVQIKFRTWMTGAQCFSTDEYIVDDNQIISFCFPSHSLQSNTIRTRPRANSIVASLIQTDRRLLISIEGWECLQPISIDRIGTFFRVAVRSDNNPLYKPILIIIDIAMTESSIRSITVKSSIELRNQLLTPIDIRCQSHLDLSHECRLEPNEICSLPIQFCSILDHIQVRPADFALDYCDEPIKWFEIENRNILDAQRDEKKTQPPEDNTINRQSFLRSCSIDGKEAVYYLCLQSKQTSLFTHQDQTLSVYQLSIHPPLTICNLLPCTLNFEMSSYHPQKIELNASKFHREHTLNILQNIDILFTTKLYGMKKSLRLPSINDLHRMNYIQQRIIFYDMNQRELYVDLAIVCILKYRLKISVSVPYVMLSKSGIPLIFKETNSKIEAAGQNAEDETAVNREPLLFSFDNTNRNNTCVMRVGMGLHRHQDGRPQWSQRFSLHPSSNHRQLQVRSSRRSFDWNYSIAIDIRPGHGYLKKINYIFLSARYMIYNQCSYKLLIAQRPIANDESTCLHVTQRAIVAYHWPRTDMEQILCVQAIDDQQAKLVHWSGGFSIDGINAFHINMRYTNGQCLILRVQIIERNGTYFVVFMDSNQMPAPFRIYNRSDIPIQFYQTDTRMELTHLRTMILPHQSLDYAWDEPTLKPTLTCSVVHGTKAIYDLLKLGFGDDLHYQNYIYLVFQAIFKEENLIEILTTTDDLFDSSSHQLVIEYDEERLFLARRQENKRSQMWHMTSHGLLIHAGSSIIQDGNKKKESSDDTRQTFVLDIQDSSNHDLISLTTSFSLLTVRLYNSKRIQTQSWQFTNDGYLCLKDTRMCVQICGELKENIDVILGPIIETTIPASTMHVRPHQQYKGSGILYVRIVADGPTNVLEIDHSKIIDLPSTSPVLSSAMYHLDLHFTAGVGISLVHSIGYEAEELIYVLVNNMHIDYKNQHREQSIEAAIDTLIISNQLLTTTKPCFLYANYPEDAVIQSAIRFQINWQKINTNFSLLHIIHSLHIDINTISIQLDEILLWKLIDFFDIEISSLSSLLFAAVGIGNITNNDRKIDLTIDDYETKRLLSLLTSTHATRIYFNKFYLSSMNLNLSVYCIHSNVRFHLNY